MADPAKRLLQDRQARQARKHQRVVLEYDTSILIDLEIEFEQLGFIFKRSKSPCLHYNTPKLNNRRFRAAFGCCSRVCSLAWLLVVDGWRNSPKEATKMRFFKKNSSFFFSRKINFPEQNAFRKSVMFEV